MGAHAGKVPGRGFPEAPALPTWRASDIRGSRGLIMQQARSARGAGPPGGSRAALTLLKFIQAAGAAEGAHGGRLPAAASLHPRGGAASEQPGATWRQALGARREARTPRWAARRRRRALAGPGTAVTTMHHCRPPAAQCTSPLSPLTPSAPREPGPVRAVLRPPLLLPRERGLSPHAAC